MRFIIQITGAIENISLYGAVDVLSFGKHLHVFGNTTGDGVHLDQFFPASVREKRSVITKRDLSQPDLRGAAPIQRAVVSKGLRFHHGDQRTAEDHHDRTVLELLLPDALKHRWESRVGLADILKLVDHDDGLCFKRALHDGCKNSIPGGNTGLMQEGASNEIRSFLLKGSAVLSLGFLTCKEEQGILALDKL